MQTPATAGFSMVELRVTVAIAALLAAIATPAFSSLFASQRAITFASELYAAVAKTRSEALTFNRSVTLTANAGGWSNGWQILDPNNPANVLENHGAEPGCSQHSGDFKIDFASGGQKFESKRINTTYTPEHANVSTSRGRSKATKVAAEGTKFIGYVVVVTDGGKVVGEFSDPSGLKAEASK